MIALYVSYAFYSKLPAKLEVSSVLVMEVLRPGEAAVTNSLASTRLTGTVSRTSPANTVR